jgi:hypothetical protein
MFFINQQHREVRMSNKKREIDNQVNDYCKREDISIKDFERSCEWLQGAINDSAIQNIIEMVETTVAIEIMKGAKQKTTDANIFFEASAVLTTLQLLQDLGIRRINASLE